MSVTRKGSFRDLTIDRVVLSGHSGDGLEQHVQGGVSGLITGVPSEFLFSGVDRNIVRGRRVTSGSLVPWSHVSSGGQILAASARDEATSAAPGATAASSRVTVESIGSDGRGECWNYARIISINEKITEA